MTSMPHPPVVLRMALACWLCDPPHGLTDAQTAWLRAKLADRTWCPTAGERQALTTPLLAWCARAQPGSLQILQQQCAQEREVS